MEKAYKCVTGEMVALGDTVEYIYNREDIEPLLRDVFSLCYPKLPIMVNGMMFDHASISQWYNKGIYYDPISHKSFDIDNITYIHALKFILLCLEDTFDDTKMVYKTVTEADGTTKQVFDREATNELYAKATVKFHAPPSNILHACRLAECLIGDNIAMIDGKPAPWIVDKNVNERVELNHPDRIEITNTIRTSAYAMNRNVVDAYPGFNEIIDSGCGGYGGCDFNSVSFSAVPQGFKLVGCKLINCNQFDHLELIDCQIQCDYKCYPLHYYVTASVNDEAVACDRLVCGANYTAQYGASNVNILTAALRGPCFEHLRKHAATKAPDVLVLPLPPVYHSLRTVKHTNDIPTVHTSITPIINRQLRLQVGTWVDPLLVGALSPEDMEKPDLKFERYWTVMTLINTNSKFKHAIREFTHWVGAMPVANYCNIFKKGEYEAGHKRMNTPRMVDSVRWYDFSGCEMSGWTFRKCEFNDTTFAGANMRGAKLINCTFSNVDFTATSLSEATFTNCIFKHIQPAYGIEHGNVKYIGCAFVDNIIEIVPGTVEPIVVPESARLGALRSFAEIESDSDSD
ncbi:hypothetical protein F-VV57_0115 [Faustovirus]|nr:hypothetical protein F-VV57_0115 [Faustovirus]QJX73382.1 hypothetical protein F-VV63_0116 [Faustovirus]